MFRDWGRRRLFAGAGVIVLLVLVTAFWRRGVPDAALTAVAERGTFTATLTASGTLRPIQSITYRSPIAGRDAEILELAPEGARVNEGDLLIRLGTTDLERDLDRYRQDLRQTEIDVQVAEGEWEEADAAVKAVFEGEGALSVEEARTRLQIAERRAERLRQEYAQLKPLMEKGFLTRDELAKTGDLMDEAEQELNLARKRTAVAIEMTHPREQKRAEVVRGQRASALAHARTRLFEAKTRMTLQQQLIDACSIYARRSGLVVYEEFLNAVPRRKLRVGDRVFSSQGVITIPEVNRMLAETTVGEAEVHRLKTGQAAAIRVEAFPDLRLTGTVSRVGTLASSSVMRPIDEKRFDLIIEISASEADLRPEMTVRADVAVGTRTNVLLIPVTAVFNRDGVFLVYVVGRTGVERRPVDLGESNERFVEVVAGLRDGERVSLVEPPDLAPAPAAAAPASPVPGAPGPMAPVMR